jgi:phospholipid/cholesterol/gamma-HCH transport system substrate-binding protein
MNTAENSSSTVFKVGLFTLLAIALIGSFSVFVNDRPFWWRACQLVFINVEDATGLRSKSPVRSLGLQIGYLNSVELSETHVRLGICITAPVEVLPSTRAYLRGDSFLGDKFVELKPVRYKGKRRSTENSETNASFSVLGEALASLLIPSAYAEDPTPVPSPIAVPTAGDRKGNRDIPVGTTQDVQHLVKQVDGLVSEMTTLAKDLKQAVDPAELRKTVVQLNKTLENASRTLSPEGGLNTTAQRTLAKLEDAIEHLRDIMARVNRGEGSLGMVLNDPTYADELKSAIKNINKLLNKVSDIRLVVDVGAQYLTGYDGGRGYFKLGIWPKIDRYYLLGVSVDPRGKRSTTTTTTTSGSTSVTTETTQVEQSGLLFTVMLGKVFWHRIDGSVGLLYNDGAISLGFLLGPNEREDMISIRNDVYTRGGQGVGLDDRVSLTLKPFPSGLFSSAYVTGGLEGFRQVGGRMPLFVGGGLTFDDEDIKLLFAFK